MKLVHTDYNLELCIEENQVIVLVIENPKVYSKLIGDIWNQMNGEEGGFILSEGEKIKNITKDMVCIFNPFSLDCNEKRILSKLYKELQEQADEQLYELQAEVNSYFVGFMDKIIETVPYLLKYNPEMDIQSLLKLFGVELETDSDTLLEKIVEYLRVMKQICLVENFVFIGLKQYLTVDEMKQLYEFVFYEKINLILLETHQMLHIEGEREWIVDKDLCIISL